MTDQLLSALESNPGDLGSETIVSQQAEATSLSLGTNQLVDTLGTSSQPTVTGFDVVPISPGMDPFLRSTTDQHSQGQAPSFSSPIARAPLAPWPRRRRPRRSQELLSTLSPLRRMDCEQLSVDDDHRRLTAQEREALHSLLLQSLGVRNNCQTH